MSEFQEGKKYEKLQPFSENFFEQVDELGDRDGTGSIFGGKVVSFDRYVKMGLPVGKILNDTIKVSRNRLKSLVQKNNLDGTLAAILGPKISDDPFSQQLDTALVNFVNEGISVVDTKSRRPLIALRNYITAGSMYDGKYGRRLDKIVSDIPDSTFIAMCRANVEKFEAERKKFSQNGSRFRQDFLTKFEGWEKRETVNVNFDSVRNRLRNAELVLADPLHVSMDEAYGSYSPMSHRINISEVAVNISEQETVFHEILHAVSGRTEVRSPIPEELEVEGTEINVQRTGVGIEERFRWLNEAITEELTEKLCSNADAYQDERRLLALLKVSGASEILDNLIYNAYFEDFDPSLPKGKRIPHWKAFYKAINEAYEPGFLVLLDKIIQEKGVRRAIQYMEDRYGKKDVSKVQ